MRIPHLRPSTRPALVAPLLRARASDVATQRPPDESGWVDATPEERRGPCHDHHGDGPPQLTGPQVEGPGHQLRQTGDHLRPAH